MSLFKNFKGIIGDILQLGGPTGPQVVHDSDEIQFQDADGNLIQIHAADGAADTEASTYGQLKTRHVNIAGGWDGASPLDASSYSGTYYLCHTSGGDYTAGIVYYSDGTSWTAVSTPKNWTLSTKTSAISGTVSMVASGFYVNEGTAGSPSWALKGDGSSDTSLTGVEKQLSMTLGTTASQSSSTSIPDGAIVTGVKLNVTTVYDNSATIAVAVGSIELMGTDESAPASAHTYSKEMLQTLSTGGTVDVTIANSPSAGVATLVVSYVESFNA